MPQRHTACVHSLSWWADLSTSEIGGVFAMIAGVGMLGTPIAATLLDKFGKVQVLQREGSWEGQLVLCS